MTPLCPALFLSPSLLGFREGNYWKRAKRGTMPLHADGHYGREGQRGAVAFPPDWMKNEKKNVKMGETRC